MLNWVTVGPKLHLINVNLEKLPSWKIAKQLIKFEIHILGNETKILQNLNIIKENFMKYFIFIMLLMQ